MRDGRGIGEAASSSSASWGSDRDAVAAAISPVRKAAIVLVSLEQSLASQLLSHLDRSAVEAVTWEIARLERVDPDDRAAVLEEFYGLGLRRLCFVFDDLVKMSDGDIRAAFHDEDLETWALALAGAAAPVRAKVLAALAAVPATGSARISTTSARSGSPTPRRPSSKSPSGYAGCMTTAASACRNPAGATKSSSSEVARGVIARGIRAAGKMSRGTSSQRICRCPKHVVGVELCVRVLGLVVAAGPRVRRRCTRSREARAAADSPAAPGASETARRSASSGTAGAVDDRSPSHGISRPRR